MAARGAHDEVTAHWDLRCRHFGKVGRDSLLEDRDIGDHFRLLDYLAVPAGVKDIL